jgi:hypothetical protein
VTGENGPAREKKAGMGIRVLRLIRGFHGQRRAIIELGISRRYARNNKVKI